MTLCELLLEFGPNIVGSILTGVFEIYEGNLNSLFVRQVVFGIVTFQSKNISGQIFIKSEEISKILQPARSRSWAKSEAVPSKFTSNSTLPLILLTKTSLTESETARIVLSASVKVPPNIEKVLSVTSKVM